MSRKNIPSLILASAFILFLAFSWWTEFDPGKQIGQNLVSFLTQMLRILPFALILVGLFEVWVKKETIEKHLGQRSGFTGYLWITLLAGTTIGGLYVAFPVAHALYKKGAKLGIILTYLGASAICRIPMTIFEASFLGVKFSLIRLVVSIPLVIVTSSWLGGYMERRGYTMVENRSD